MHKEPLMRVNPSGFPAATILVVDDIPENVEILARLLTTGATRPPRG
jgi:hypothetical protein